MTLANLIRKREPATPANANPAKAANDGQARGTPLARLATLALANAAEEKPDIIAALSEPANIATSWGWRVTYPGGSAFESYIVPEQTLRQVQGIYPGAKIEPIAEVAE